MSAQLNALLPDVPNGAPVEEGWHVVEWRSPSGTLRVSVVEAVLDDGRVTVWVGGRFDECTKYSDSITRHTPLPDVAALDRRVAEAEAQRDAADVINGRLQREKARLEADLAGERQQHAISSAEMLTLLSVYAMNYGQIRVTEEFALQIPVRVYTRRRDGGYEVVGTDLPNEIPARLGVLVMLAVRRVTATVSEDDVYALLQALACPAICAADPVKLGTAAVELADLVSALRGSGTVAPSLGRRARAYEELTRCCRMLTPLLDEPTRREVHRRLGGGLDEPTRVRTHDRDCLCHKCLDDAGRGR